jgi:hypothetical protein
MMYSWIARNYEKDLIYQNRLRLIAKKNINIHKSKSMYIYYMNAYLGILLY